MNILSISNNPNPWIGHGKTGKKLSGIQIYIVFGDVRAMPLLCMATMRRHETSGTQWIDGEALTI